MMAPLLGFGDMAGVPPWICQCLNIGGQVPLINGINGIAIPLINGINFLVND